MPIVKPFKAIRYNKKKIKDLARVIAPPYDIIPEKMQDELYRKDPHNVVRLILNKITSKDTASDNRYTRSKRYFDSWLDKNILAQDDAESFYIYSQKYKQGKKDAEQAGFIGLMGLDLGGEEKVLPHENTLAAPKEDRLKLMRSVRANLSPIFILYDDSKITKLLKSFCARNKAIIDVKWEGVRHRVWKAGDPAVIRIIRSRMKAKSVFIADGHHRYEVAKIYSKEAQASSFPDWMKENSKYMMVYFVEADEKMLTVLPTHRVIKDLGNLGKDDIIGELKNYFHTEKVRGLDNILPELHGSAAGHVFGMYLGKGNFYVLKLKSTAASDAAIKDKPKEWKRLGVSILHLFIFQHLLGISDSDDNVEFLKDPADAVKAVDSDKFKAAFFLSPTKVSQVKRIAKLGERMPRKSTYFYPKPLSGLVINKL